MCPGDGGLGGGLRTAGDGQVAAHCAHQAVVQRRLAEAGLEGQHSDLGDDGFGAVRVLSRTLVHAVVLVRVRAGDDQSVAANLWG